VLAPRVFFSRDNHRVQAPWTFDYYLGNLATPRIETDRLLLAAFTKADAADVFAYASNPNVARFTTWMPHQAIADSQAFIDMVLARPANEHIWAIRLRTENRVVGAVEFGLASDREAQLDYVLAEPLWNKGIMTEAARAVLAWGLEKYPTIRRVRSCAVSQNIGSQRVMQKCGMQFVGSRMHRWSKYPEPVEQVEYALTR
jgi:[ribosomal protein S5]-alanine N-acetyltransferase